MTGQHEFKVGISHTISGRSLLKPDVATLPEHLQAAGYRTAIFGKWHLGETYPSRPQDRGFDEVFIHLGGGIGQTPDYWDNRYDDPHIHHNGHWQATRGYCTAVFCEAAKEWIGRNSSQPWLAYLSLNAPHTPLEIDDRLAQKYLERGLPESQARFYAMIEDLDREVGELLQTLEAQGIADNTIVVFMGDNGSAKGGRPDQMEFNAGLRGTKASPYQGGVRVPCFIRWPNGQLLGGRAVDVLTHMIDLFPTLAELAGLPLDAHCTIDGRSLVPLLQSKTDVPWPERSIVTHVGRWPNGTARKHKFHGSAIRNERFTLVNGTELYDLHNDPGEQHDVSQDDPDTFKQLNQQYTEWWNEVLPQVEDVPPITVGAAAAPVSHLTCMDWGASRIDDQGDRYPPWNQDYIRALAAGGRLNTSVAAAPGPSASRAPAPTVSPCALPEEAPESCAQIRPGTAELWIGDTHIRTIPDGSRAVRFELPIQAGVTTLESSLPATTHLFHRWARFTFVLNTSVRTKYSIYPNEPHGTPQHHSYPRRRPRLRRLQLLQQRHQRNPLP